MVGARGAGRVSWEVGRLSSLSAGSCRLAAGFEEAWELFITSYLLSLGQSRR